MFCVVGSVCAAWMFAASLMPVSASVHAASVNSKQHGESLFQEKGCEYCHGIKGIGGAKGPDLRDVRKRLNKDQMTRQISEGGGAMPAFGSSLEPSDIHDLVEYLRSKRK